MTAQIYVGTYAKYNNGFIDGKWLELSNYSDSSEFYDACAELHSDEDDPEFMFQDYEGFPSDLYDESGNIDAVYEYLDFCESSYLDQDVIDAGLSLDIEMDNLEEAYSGSFDSDEDFAYEQAEQCGLIDNNVSWPYTCIDWDHAARELMYDYCEQDGHYFRNF